ncbi:shTK domain protein [Oesophagostomum dentatum]|nr:shTK domain protein [Oesophagostomum dentatum]
MNVVCPASCKKCNPTTYTLQDDCSDRHHLCDVYKQNGDCESNASFMAENCRKTCNVCGKPRSDGCS